MMVDWFSGLLDEHERLKIDDWCFCGAWRLNFGASSSGFEDHLPHNRHTSQILTAWFNDAI